MNARRCWLLLPAWWMLLASTAQAIVVYDLRIDFSNTSNPNGTWRYYQGTNLLAHNTPVTNISLALAASSGYWGNSGSSDNSAILRTTAAGGATGLWSNADFLANEVLVRTTDPTTGDPMIVTWTAPSNGSFTYSGFFWNANAPLGPASNSYTMSLNAGPAMESGTALLGQDRTNVVGMVNGLTPVNVTAGDILLLEFTPSIGPPSGSLSGISLTLDFTPDEELAAGALPEPGTVWLLAGSIGAIIRRNRRDIAPHDDAQRSM